MRYQEVIENPYILKNTMQFALGLTSARNFEEGGGLGRQLVRKHGSTYARRLLRKALKRRGLLNSYNIVNTKKLNEAA